MTLSSHTHIFELKPHGDQIELKLDSKGLKIEEIKVYGCYALLKRVELLKPLLAKPIAEISIPFTQTHVDLLLKKALLSIQGNWHLPYSDSEVCHCRAVSLDRIENAILGGALTRDRVRKLTTASSACGSCAPDINSLISYITMA